MTGPRLGRSYIQKNMVTISTGSGPSGMMPSWWACRTNAAHMTNLVTRLTMRPNMIIMFSATYLTTLGEPQRGWSGVLPCLLTLLDGHDPPIPLYRDQVPKEVTNQTAKGPEHVPTTIYSRHHRDLYQ